MWRFHTSPSCAGEPLRARDDVREPLVVPEAPRERVDDRPPPHALAVEVERLAQTVDAAADPPGRMRVGGELRAAVAQQRGDVEGALAGERLGVDGQPRPAAGAQDVAAVEVLALRTPAAGAAR